MVNALWVSYDNTAEVCQRLQLFLKLDVRIHSSLTPLPLNALYILCVVLHALLLMLFLVLTVQRVLESSSFQGMLNWSVSITHQIV